MNINDKTPMQVIDIMLAMTDGKSKKELAKDVDVKYSTLVSSLTRQTLRLTDFLRLADQLGYDVKIEKRGE